MPAKQRLKLRLKTGAFDDLAERAFHDNPSQREIGERMGASEATWSLVRAGKRPVPYEFIARFVERFPRHNLSDYAEPAPQEGFDS